MKTIIVIAVAAFVLNLPLGYLRHLCRPYSFSWFLYIHLSVPVIIAARIYFHAPLITIPLYIVAAVMGQFIGGKMGEAS
jgi:hypothetical protein